ncbi:MAG: right-handed parallel beta-helix repeat-containing protein [Planctomycetota bacterium]
MSPPEKRDDRDAALILAFLEDTLAPGDEQAFAQRLKTDAAFARRLAVQARLTAGLEALARLEAHTPEALAAAGAKASAEAGKRGPGGRRVAHLRPERPERPVRPTGPTVPTGRSLWRRRVFMAVAGVLLVCGVAAAWSIWGRRATAGPGAQQAIGPQPGPKPGQMPVAVAQVESLPADLPVSQRPLLIRASGPAGAADRGTPVVVGMAIYPGDRLETLGSGGAAAQTPTVQVTIRQNFGATIDIANDSELLFPLQNLPGAGAANSCLQLNRGHIYCDLATRGNAEDLPGANRSSASGEGKPGHDLGLCIATPNAEFSILSASCELAANRQQTLVRVVKGAVDAFNRFGHQIVGALEECTIPAGAAPGPVATVFAGSIWRGRAGGGNAQPAPDVALAGAFRLESPTEVCLSAHWIVAGDNNCNARVYCRYRRAGTPDVAASWRISYDFWPLDATDWPLDYHPTAGLAPGERLFAGSLFGLTPGTAYVLEFHLADPDGQGAVQVLQASTRAEPHAAADAHARYVVPETAAAGATPGGAGTQADPFRGLQAADAAAQPGDVFHLAPGIYVGTFAPTRDGVPANAQNGVAEEPIVWAGDPGGGTVLEGRPEKGQRAGQVISANLRHDLIFENLTLRKADYLFIGEGAQRLAILHCTLSDCRCGITGTDKDGGRCEDWTIADNIFHGSAVWPDSGKGDEGSQGIYMGGRGHVIEFNHVDHFGDGIATCGSAETVDDDICNNDIAACTDDGIALDGSVRNVRCFANRIVNVSQGIGAQSVAGGPVYILRNELFNIAGEPFKLNHSPHGVLILHNTVVKTGAAVELSTTDPVYRCVSRNNLFIGAGGPFALDFDSTMLGCDFDWDGCGGTFDQFMLWNRTVTPTIAAAHDRAGAEQHAVAIDPTGCFADGILPPTGELHVVALPAGGLELAPRSAAVDAGTVLPGIDDDFKGQAPDLGAVELGAAEPHYGPR